jgi:hydroxyacid-oxoacid transhydrogenase
VTTERLETVFSWSAPPILFGAGALEDVGPAVAALGARRVAVVTDRGIVSTGLVDRIQHALAGSGATTVTYAAVHVEPTDESMTEAAGWARGQAVDAFVAIGGGSVIDTAKGMDLLATNDGSVEDYLNAPIGRGRPPTRPLAPLIAIPTTAGTGSESTPVCVMDVLALKVKTGISHPSLRPRLAIVDPTTTLTLPPAVTAASGMDVLCHALESFTARPFAARERHAPGDRPAYNGANPISDIWAAKALELLGRWFRRAVATPDDLEAREGMMLAATYAGVGFGNAGVHLPHACAYPIAGMVRDYVPAGYDVRHPMVPHGQSVIATAPAAFRFTYATDPDRHDTAARLLAGNAELPPGPDTLPGVIVDLCRDVGIPNGIGAFGYTEADVDGLVAGALKQQRLLAISPRPAAADDLAAILRASMTNWPS